MAERLILIDADSILRLLTHYTEGVGMPLTAELRFAGVSPLLGKWICLEVESPEWDEAECAKPMHVRYEGKRVITWDASKPQEATRGWGLEGEAYETPRIQ